MPRFLARPTTLGAANTPVSVRALIAALSPAFTGITAFSQLMVINDTSDGGNLVVSDDPAVATEAAGAPVQDTFNLGPADFGNFAASGSEIYLLSATLNKKIAFIGLTAF